MTDTNQKLREALRELMSIVSIHQKATRNNFAWAEMDFAREALALQTAAQVDDINVAESFTSVTKTAAPVGERDAFEHDLSKSPFEFDMDRWPDNAPVDWPGSYKQYHVQCAWAAWQARAALSAGDAVDAQRYRWLREQNWSNSDICCVNKPKQNVRLGGMCPSGDLLDAVIDAALRKGQL